MSIIVWALVLGANVEMSKLVVEEFFTQIRVYNNTTISIDASGWQVQGKDGSMYELPQGTIIPPNGFVVIPVDEVSMVLSPPNKEIRKARSSPLQVARKVYDWFNPVVETESNLTQPDAHVKVVGGMASQQVVGPLMLGLGGKYVKTLNETETYMGIGKFNLSFNRFGNIVVRHEHPLKGRENREHPKKTIFTWNIPTVLGMNVSFNRERRWTEEFKANFNSIDIERSMGSNTVLYNRYLLQNFTEGFKTIQTMIVGMRHTVRITTRISLSTFAELFRNTQTNEVHQKTFNSSLDYFTSELSRLSITTTTHLWNHKHNHIFQFTTIVPLKFGLYLGAKGEVNYHIPKRIANWYWLNRRTGIAYIPPYTTKFRIVGSLNENKTPWKGYQLADAYKIIMYPVRSLKISLKYTHMNDETLKSVWVKYLNRYFEFGVGGRVLNNNGTPEYGLSVEGGVRKFKKFDFVCGYRGGYNLIGMEGRELVDSYYQAPSYYVKMTISENSFEALFEEE